MNCPNCGSDLNSDHRFCRFCGESLSADFRRPIPPVFWGLVIAFGGIMIAMGGKIIDLRWMLFAGVFLAITGMFFIPASSILRRSRRRKRKVTIPARTPPIQAVETTNKLHPMPSIDHFSSVTESTTELLKMPAEFSTSDESLK